MTSPAALEAALSLWRHKLQEHFLVASLDVGQWLKKINVVAIGTAHIAPVHPRDIFRVALLDNASFIVVAHNHPSGSLEPSQADIELTERLVELGRLMHVPMIEHYIFTTTGVCRMTELEPHIFGAP